MAAWRSRSARACSRSSRVDHHQAAAPTASPATMAQPRRMSGRGGGLVAEAIQQLLGLLDTLRAIFRRHLAVGLAVAVGIEPDGLAALEPGEVAARGNAVRSLIWRGGGFWRRGPVLEMAVL